MADNVVANAGSGGATWATDDVSGVHYPISKLAYGVLDSVTLVSTSNGFPVQFVSGSTVAATQSGTWNIANISGTVSLPTGAATEATLSALNAKVTAVNTGAVVIASGTVAATQSGTWSSRLQDGSGNALTSAARGSERAMSVQIVDASGAQVTSFGGTNASVGTTGAAVPASATYAGVNIGGNLTGVTGATRGSEKALSVQIVDGSGNQVTSFGGSGGTASNFASAFPASGTAAGWSDGTNMQGARVFDADTGAGSQYVMGANLRISGSGGSIEAKGSQTSANSIPVVIASDQGTVPVSLASVPSHAVTNAGTFAVQIDSAALTSLALIDDAVSGTGFNVSQMNGVNVTMGNGASGTGVQRVTIANDSTGILAGVTTVTTLTGGGVAHDGVDSGNPHKIGARATASLSGATMVAAADRTDVMAGVDGVVITRPHTNLEDLTSGNASVATDTSTQVIAAAGAGIKVYLTTIILTNTSATNTYCEIKDGTTVKLTIPVPANGGAVVSLPAPLGGTANTAWNFDPGTAVTTMYCSMIGFKSKI